MVNEEIFKIITEMFGYPCEYGDLESNMMEKANEWCDVNCDTEMESGIGCWKKFFEMKIAKKEEQIAI